MLHMAELIDAELPNADAVKTLLASPHPTLAEAEKARMGDPELLSPDAMQAWARELLASAL